MNIKQSLSLEAVEAEFLKAEWYLDFYNPARERFTTMVMQPDVSNAEHNRIRNNFLRQSRQRLFDHVPPDIQWYLGELDGNEFGDISIVNEATWSPVFGSNKKLKDVAKVIFLNQVPDDDAHVEKIKRFKNRIGAGDFHGKIIVICSALTGPFSIFEGNHRAVAFQLKMEESGDKSLLPREIILGHSPRMASCVWFNGL